MTIVFWTSALLLFHAYFGYALTVWVIARLFGSRQPLLADDVNVSTALPRIAFIIPAYNEAAVIEAKCRNTLALDYPADRLEVIVVTDGSTDGTPDRAESVAGIRVLHAPNRAGKSAAINLAVLAVPDAEFLVFSDANTQVSANALRVMMAHYKDPRIGGVCGEKRVAQPDGHPVRGEGLYWRYESRLKRLDAAFHSVIAAAGELFSIRAALFQPLPADTILDDLHLTLQVCMQGYCIAYEPGAVAMEMPSGTLPDEYERKVRIAAGAFQTIKRFPGLLLPFRYGRLWYIYISRRMFRWVVAPVGLPLLLWSNLNLVVTGTHPSVVYNCLLSGQCVFYAMALYGWMAHRQGRTMSGPVQASFYFVFMHVALWQGFLRHLLGRQPATWQKSSRI